MSYDQRGRPVGAPGPRTDGDAQKGSVRAARQRMQAAQMRNQLPDTSKIIGLPQRPNQLVSQYSTQSRAEQQRSTPAGRRDDVDSVSPPPQWPLPNEAAPPIDSNPAIPPRSPKRLQQPQPIARPLSDDFPIQQLSPGYGQPASPDYLQPPSAQYGQRYQNDEMFSPSSYRSSRPLTTSSAASEASSLGSIPDFPVPQPPLSAQQQVRRVPGLGPPPSARRGPSSYYTQMSYVSPIVEESEGRSDVFQSRHGSFASSNVFPSRNDDYYPNDDYASDDESTITSERGTISPSDPDDRRILVQQSPALVRQASLGRRTKPSLMTIKSVDSLDNKKGAGKMKAGVGAAALGGAMLAASHGKIADVASSSSESLNSVQRATNASGGFGHPLQQEMRPATLAERAGMRRPPKLDIDAVRDAEARGSLTSLPELIRRATRLAANLDRGKTASRLGLDFWEAGAPERKDVRQSGLSDMLAAFPPPGQDTPLRSGTPNATNNRMSKWPSAGDDSRGGVTDSRMNNEKSGRRRRCCGMPMWTFVTLLIVLLFIIAAAVVIPVVLVVIPNQNKANSSAAQDGQGNNGGGSGSGGSNSRTSAMPAPTLAPGNSQCDGLISCQNGGIPILNSDRTCNCVCINGFTGTQCTNNDATGCATTSIAGAANNATMGTAISRLIGNDADDFAVPLNSTRVLSLFSELSLSCAAQNALVTFNGLASRSDSHFLHSLNLRHTLEPSRSLPVLHHLHPAQAPELNVKRQAIGEPGRSTGEKAAQPSATPTLPVSSNQTAVDFARVGVLFSLQESGELDVAAKAQEAVQNFLTNNRNGNSATNAINMGPFRMDLVQLTISFNNGTTIRATPSPSSSSS
ncbi:hypothetical protein FB567DRAFT_450244 [Paraphoma chrysanthemicola]|uniref:EGF-like domain-containing protein n=1 Tax=Paraphoma chrysanthemicola TaxID=798071 RepID=A0A8K0QYC5_9PLEO|nr:hypothetical protein FB567DRAFT_450244 [Paraphoma chrysanthemicola]